MKPTDHSWKEILDLMEVPAAPGLFILGSYARRVTIYSQQVRALNLADALAGMGYVSCKTQVAVVGAGFAGITLAGALAQMGAATSIYEKEKAMMNSQLNCRDRYIHPHIYEWPLKKIQQKDAGLPLLNWQAKFSSEVAREVTAEWKNKYAHLASIFFDEAVTSLEAQDQQWRVKTTKDDKGRVYDLVILAVGFGVEKLRPYAHSYWADLPLSEVNTQKRTWTVSGAGDGALTDVIRLCVQNHDHAEALSEAVAAVEMVGGQEFLELLEQRLKAGVTGPGLFEGLDAEKVAERLHLRETPITLNASEDAVFGSAASPPGASVLNRCFTWILWKSGRLTFRPGNIELEGISGNRGEKLTIPFEDGSLSPIETSEVLVRHGPQRILPSLTEHKRESGKKEPSAPASSFPAFTPQQLKLVHRHIRKWNQMYDEGKDDPTLRVEWPANAFGKNRLPPDFRGWPGLLLISKQEMGTSVKVSALKNAAKAVFRRGSVRAQLDAITPNTMTMNGDFPCLDVEDAIKDARALSSAIHALCMAPVALVDATTITPALAFILGVRSAVRRGVTIVCREGNMSVEAWKELPFNLREVRMVKVSDRSSGIGFESPVAAALEEGLRRFNRHPLLYEDLPGFDALRNLGGHEDDTSPRDGSKEVLVLCPFEEAYESTCWNEIERAVRTEFSPNAVGGAGPAKRVIDLATPEVLARRLCEAIRLDFECIVDLTYQRPNVYFELGVRMVSHPGGARIIHCVDLQPAPEDSNQEPVMGALLGSMEYRCKDADLPRAEHALNLAAPWGGGLISPGFPYSVAQRCVELRQEAGCVSVLNLLWEAVALTGGSDRQKQQTPPVLYAGNPGIKKNSTRFIVEGLLAYLLLARHLAFDHQQDPRSRIALEDIRSKMEDVGFSAEEKAAISKLIDSITQDS